MPDISGDFLAESNTTTTAEGFVSLPEREEKGGGAASPQYSPTPADKMEVMMSRERAKTLWKDEKWIILNKSTFERIFDNTLLQMTADVRSSPIPPAMTPGRGDDACGASTPSPPPSSENQISADHKASRWGRALPDTGGVADGRGTDTPGQTDPREPPGHPSAPRSGPGQRGARGVSAAARGPGATTTTAANSRQQELKPGHALAAPGQASSSALTDPPAELPPRAASQIKSPDRQGSVITDPPAEDATCLENNPTTRDSLKPRRGLKRSYNLKETLDAIDKFENKLPPSSSVARCEVPDKEANKSTMIIDKPGQVLASRGDLRANNTTPANPVGLKQHKETIDGSATRAPADLASRCSNNNGHITSSTACVRPPFITRTNKSRTRTTGIGEGQHLNTTSKASPKPDDQCSGLGGSGVDLPADRAARAAYVSEDGGRRSHSPATSPPPPPASTVSAAEPASAARRFADMPGSGGAGDYNLPASPARTSLDIIASVCSTREKLKMAIANNGDDCSKADGRHGDGVSVDGSDQSVHGESARGTSVTALSASDGGSVKGDDGSSLNSPIHSPSERSKNPSATRHGRKLAKPKRSRKVKSEGKSQQRWVALNKNVVFNMVELAFGDHNDDNLMDESLHSDYQSSHSNSTSPRHTATSEDDCQGDIDDSERLPRHPHTQADQILAETRRGTSSTPGSRYNSLAKIDKLPADGANNVQSAPRKNVTARMIETDSKEDRTGALNSEANVRGSRTPGKPDEGKNTSPAAALKAGADDRLTWRENESIRVNTSCLAASEKAGSKINLSRRGNAISEKDENRVKVPSACFVGHAVARRDDCALRSLLGPTPSSSAALTSNKPLHSRREAANSQQREEHRGTVRRIDCLVLGNEGKAFSGLISHDGTDAGANMCRLEAQKGQALDLSTRSTRKSTGSTSDSSGFDVTAHRYLSDDVSHKSPPDSPVDMTVSKEPCSPRRPRTGSRGGSYATTVGATAGSTRQTKSSYHSKALESPKPGWVALSKAEVHTIVDSVMSTMLGDNDASGLEPSDPVTLDSSGSRDLGEATASPARHSVARSGRGQTTSDKSGLPPKLQSSSAPRHQTSRRSGETLSQPRANDIHDLSSANTNTTPLMTFPNVCDDQKFTFAAEQMSPKQEQRKSEDKESVSGDIPAQSGATGDAKNSCRGGPFKWKSNMLKRAMENTCDDSRTVSAKRPRANAESENAGKSHPLPLQAKPNNRHNKRRHGNAAKSGNRNKASTVHGN